MIFYITSTSKMVSTKYENCKLKGKPWQSSSESDHIITDDALIMIQMFKDGWPNLAIRELKNDEILAYLFAWDVGNRIFQVQSH